MLVIHGSLFVPVVKNTKMKKFLTLIAAFAITLLSSCDAIAGIFKAGMGFGIFIVLFVIILIVILVLRRRK
jgi:hypothetical protein